MESSDTRLSGNPTHRTSPQRGQSFVEPPGCLGQGQGRLSVGLWKPGAKSLYSFCITLRSCISAGVPILSAFRILSESVPNRSLKKACLKIASEVDAGIPIEKAMRSRRRIFSPFFTSIFLSGLRSGSVVQSLDQLIEHYAWVLELRTAILRVVWYPIFLLFAGSLIMAAPPLVAHFRNNPFTWPEAIRIVFFFLRFPLLGVLAAYLMAKVVKMRPVRPVTDEIVIRIPILGKCLTRYSLAIFFRIFAASVAAGRELGAGFEAAIEAMNNYYLARRLRGAERFLRSGEAISAALSLTGVIDKQALGMVEVGEISGSLPVLSRKLAEYYMTETKTLLLGFIKAFFPLLIVMVAIAYFYNIHFLGYGAFLMFFFVFLTM